MVHQGHPQPRVVLDTLLPAVWRRKPAVEVLVHSDQDRQYGSDDFKRFCKAHSLCRRGNCWDNAVMESLFSSLKKEHIRKRIDKIRDITRADVFDYIEAFYNRSRRHSHLSNTAPRAFERARELGSDYGLRVPGSPKQRSTLLWIGRRRKYGGGARQPRTQLLTYPSK